MERQVSFTRIGNITTVTVVTILSAPVYYWWYVDGAFVDMTRSNSHSFYVETGDQVRIDVIDNNDPNFDPYANAPAGYPSRRTIWWVRSLSTDVAYYRIAENKDAAGWSQVATVYADDRAWTYSYLTDRLDDLASYQWRVVPVDTLGNDGAVLARDAETIVRTPDSPNFSATFDAGTGKVTFSAV